MWNLIISVLSWCGNSADLNPIENLWVIIKKRLRKHDCSTKTADYGNYSDLALWWGNSYNFQKTYNISMPEQVNMLTKARRGHIKH